MTNNKNFKFFSTISLFQNAITKGLTINNFLFLFYFIILIFIFSLYLSNNVVYCMENNNNYEYISFNTQTSYNDIYDNIKEFRYSTKVILEKDTFVSLANCDAIYDAKILKEVPSNFKIKLITLVNIITDMTFSTTSLTTTLPSTVKDILLTTYKNYLGLYIEGFIDSGVFEATIHLDEYSINCLIDRENIILKDFRYRKIDQFINFEIIDTLPIDKSNIFKLKSNYGIITNN